jgi:hypothetical protein
VQVLQAILAGTSVMFGVLWVRAVRRATKSLLERAVMVRRFAAVLGALDKVRAAVEICVLGQGA